MDDTARPDLPAKDGRFKLNSSPLGIYLKVYPPENGGAAVETSAVVDELKRLDVTLFLLPEITTAVQEASKKAVLIAAPTEETAPAEVNLPLPEIKLQIRRDRLQAVVTATAIPDGAPLTKEMLLQHLHAAGVKYGIVFNALTALEQAGHGKDVCVARGLAAQTGAAAELIYHVDIEAQGRPEEIAGQRVDFKNIHMFTSVTANQLLVEKKPSQPGIPGTDVFGNELPAKQGKDVALPVGKHVLVKDGLQLVAEIDGQLHIAHGRVGVLPLLEIQGDVDYSTGNIDFIGSVLIRGSLQCGFSVKAAGNVEICGSVSGGSIDATTILVRKGIQGMHRSQINAREDILAMFVENATLCAGKTVTISDVVMNSSVFAGIKISVGGKRGKVLGGRLSAGEEICCQTVGNHTQILTKLEVAGNPFLKDELDSLRRKLAEYDALHQESRRLFFYLANRGIDNLDDEKRERHDKLAAQCNALEELMLETNDRISDIEEILKSLKPGIIRVADVMYPGTQISIGRLSRTIADALQYLSLYVHDGEIRFSSDY